MPAPKSASETPRMAAARLLGAVLGDGRMLSEEPLGSLAAPDRARAQRLASETLRNLSRADHVLAAFLRKPPPLAVQNVLRIATVELCSGGDAHGVVNDAVNRIARTKNGQALKGLANAVLRKVATEGTVLWAEGPHAYLADWIRKPLLAAWGKEAVRAMETTFSATPPLDLTAKTDPAALATSLGGQLLPTGSVRLPAGQQVSTLPGFETGAFWVQDAAAALPARLLAPQKGERVLDICAAPGGKTMQLATMGADVTALDISPRRMERVRENLARTNLTARLFTGDALDHQGQYNAILLDAPCSATGTLRRHPDLPHVRAPEAIADLAALQSQLIDHALTLLAPGGRLVFCTCSLMPEEGEAQARAMLTRHPSLKVDRPALEGVPAEWITQEGGLRTRPDYWPDQGGLDGFYMIRVTRP